MATLTALPHQAIIDGLKGKIDFYVHDGTPCARRWPRSPGKRRAPAVEAQWPKFAYVAGLWTSLSQTVQDAYNTMASGSGLTGRDLFTRGYITGIYRYDL
ncbi:hypothetical protein ES705_35843 [subsurface metagenome]